MTILLIEHDMKLLSRYRCEELTVLNYRTGPVPGRETGAVLHNPEVVKADQILVNRRRKNMAICYQEVRDPKKKRAGECAVIQAKYPGKGFTA